VNGELWRRNPELVKSAMKLASEPDPAKAPVRGTSVAAPRVALVGDEDAAYRAHLERFALSDPDPNRRAAAAAVLEKEGGA
jgi:hypothetical protein